MKIISSGSSKRLVISRVEWEKIGVRRGWLRGAGERDKARDTEWREAVRDGIWTGDMGRAEQMVAERASERGYNLGPLQHDTRWGGTELKPGGGWIGSGPGIWLSDFGAPLNAWHNIRERDFTRHRLFAEMWNTLVIDSQESLDDARKRFSEGSELGDERLGFFADEFPWLLTPVAVADVMRSGHDGIILDMPGKQKEYIVFASDRVKSAEGVTYDDSGMPILLSERFDPSKADIRW